MSNMGNSWAMKAWMKYPKKVKWICQYSLWLILNLEVLFIIGHFERCSSWKFTINFSKWSESISNGAWKRKSGSDGCTKRQFKVLLGSENSTEDSEIIDTGSIYCMFYIEIYSIIFIISRHVEQIADYSSTRWV